MANPLRDGAGTVRIVAWTLRGVGCCVVAAVASLWWQLPGLIGANGLTPVADAIASQDAATLLLRAPSVVVLWPHDLALNACCAVALGCGLLLVAGRLTGPALLGLWASWLSLVAVGRPWLSFQWDALLVEVAFTALAVGAWQWRARAAPPSLGVWALRLLAFKLMFFAGYAKIASGDPMWASLTALTVHYQTQPLPNPLAWAAHHLPLSIQQATCFAVLAIELVAPWFVFAGRWGRLFAFIASFVLMVGLFATGNYGYFQPLTVALCLSWLDDGHLAWLGRAARLPSARAPVRSAFAAIVMGVSCVVMAGQLAGSDPIGAIAPLRTVNRYGLFATMTDTRDEIVFEGTKDGVEWAPYVLPAQPGPLDRRPPVLGVGLPRLDWLMWFAALGDCRSSPWVAATQAALVEERPEVAALFAAKPFADGEVRAVRATRYRYRFAPRGAADWWMRAEVGPYCPAVAAVGVE